MHQNYFFLRKLADKLNRELNGYKLIQCFTQNKNELLIQFSREVNTLSIKVHLGPSFCCISFPEKISKKKINTANIFKDLFALKVTKVASFTNERAFYIEFQKKLRIVFQMFGTRSNVFLYSNEVFVSGFRKIHTDSRDFSNFNMQNTGVNGDSEGGYLAKNPQLLGFPNKELQRRGIGEKVPSEQQEMVDSIIEELNSSVSFNIIRRDGKLRLSLIETSDIVEHFDNPMEAVTQFYFQYIRENQLIHEKSKYLSHFKKQLVKTSNYIGKGEQKVEGLKTRSNLRQIGDLIMANLHEIKQHSKSASLYNFYTNETIVIKLNPDLIAQKNAERYYRKAKNQSQEIGKLEENIKTKKSLLIELKSKIEFIENETSVKALRKVFNPAKRNKPSESIPYNERVYKNFKILIGKGAKQNDTLLQKYSWKEDLWLHARDGPGSHVLIKFQSGKEFPPDVIEHAAQLAAFHSKRKNDTITPVIYTPRKFVRKRKGDPAGMVVVEKEKVILVEPSRKT